MTKKKKITLTVTLEFSSKVTEEFITRNVMTSLQHTINTVGLVDDADEQYTKSVKVVNEKGEGCKINLENFSEDIILIKKK